MSRLLIVLAALLLTGGCTSSPSVFDPPEALRDFAPEYTVKRVWNRQIGRGIGERYPGLPLLLDHGVLYVADVQGTVSAVNADDGELLWRQDLGAPIRGGPGNGPDYILIGGDATVSALSKLDGRLLWQAPVTSEVVATPIGAEEVVIARAIDGFVFGISALDGQRLWQAESRAPLLSLRGDARPAVADGTVVLGQANGRVAAISLRSGRLLWETALAVPSGRTELERLVDVGGAIAFHDGTVFAGAYQGRIAALSVGSGRIQWSRELSTYLGVATDGIQVYTAGVDGLLWALAAGSGATVWQQDAMRGRWPSAIALQENAIVVADHAGYVLWFAREDGRPLARMRVEPPLFDFPGEFGLPGQIGDPLDGRGVVTAPVVDGQRIYAMNRDGVINAFEVSIPGRR